MFKIVTTNSYAESITPIYNINHDFNVIAKIMGYDMFINYHSVPKERDIQGAKLRFNSHLERGFAHNFTEKNNFYHCIRFVCH